MKCLKCGSDNGLGTKFCRGCGSKCEAIESIISDNANACQKCGQAYQIGKKFCEKCGTRLDVNQTAPRTERSIATEAVDSAVSFAAIGSGCIGVFALFLVYILNRLAAGQSAYDSFVMMLRLPGPSFPEMHTFAAGWFGKSILLGVVTVSLLYAAYRLSVAAQANGLRKGSVVKVMLYLMAIIGSGWTVLSLLRI